MRSLLEPRMGMRGVALDCTAEAAAAAKMADLLNGRVHAEGGASAQARSLLWQLRDAGSGEYKVLIGRGGLGAAGRLALCALVLLLSGCVYLSRRTLPGACSADLGSPIRNFCVVRPGVLWRAEAPTRADAQWLVEHGVGTVVSLQLDVRRSFESVHVDPGQTRSIAYFRVGDFSAIQVLTHRHLDQHVAEVLAIIQKAPKPVLISCRAGVDRTGVIAAAYRMLVQGWSAKRAIADMDGFHSPWDPLNNRYVLSISGARKERILRSITQWRARSRPTGRFDCRAGSCRFLTH